MAQKLKGYQGKILRVDLTTRKISTIDTYKYAVEYVGGHGMASAIFWDLCEDKTIDGFDPRNIVTFMNSPISATVTPSGPGRTEICGIGVQSSPVGWYTRSNFGGRFSTQMKFAGWDGIVIEGKADSPVYLDIRNDQVVIQDASHLWGMTTWKAQEEIWEAVNKSKSKDGWKPLHTGRDSGYTTQKPAVVAIGPAGENLGRVACLIHDAGNGGGQGGFGGILGSKNLKAISIIGTESHEVADPNALLEARINAKENYGQNLQDLKDGWVNGIGKKSSPTIFYDRLTDEGRPQGCVGCIAACRGRFGHGKGSESSCVETIFYSAFNKKKFGGKNTIDTYIAADLLQEYGVNAYEALRGLEYIAKLNEMGIFGPGLEIDCSLDFSQLGTAAFAEDFIKMMSYREGVGDDMAEGFYRAAERWGRLEEDLTSGILEYPYWGLPEHLYDPRAEVSWGYGTIMAERDMNEHDFNGLYWSPSGDIWAGREPDMSAEFATKIIADKLVPFEGNPNMLNYADDNIYSEDIAKLVAWQKRYGRFWKQSVLFCDFRWPDFYNANDPNYVGITGDKGEPVFLNAVTGHNMNFMDGLNIGQKIWNLDNAIWALQGRTREMVTFADYIFNVPFHGGYVRGHYYLPGIENGEWKYFNSTNRKLDRDKFEEWKTKYYQIEEWDVNTGWPTRATLEKLGLKHVADELEKAGKLGK